MKDPWCNVTFDFYYKGRESQSQPGHLFFYLFSTKMITFVSCNIFDQIWYSEFIL